MPSAIPSRAQWQSMVQGLQPSADVDRCTALVLAYQLKLAADTDERLQVLDNIDAATGDYLDAHGMAGPGPRAVMLLHLAAAKERRMIGKATHAWGVARKVFGPSVGAVGPTHTLQHYFAGEADPNARRNYWLESADPRHRSWGHQPAREALFDRWVHAPTTEDFWTWLDRHATAESRNIPSVAYLAPDQRYQYQVFHQGRLLYVHQSLNPAAPPVAAAAPNPLVPFSTRTFSSIVSGPGFAIWVCSPQGTFYSNVQTEDVFHHSSFLAGGRVLAAGEWVVADGKVKLINHKSGHYRPTPMDLYRALGELQQVTDLNETIVGIVVPDAVLRFKYIKATDFLNTGGQADHCAAVRDHNGLVATTAFKALGSGYQGYFGLKDKV